jgi:hypothetical protein
VTIDQILQLKKAGVTDAVILALIERDQTVFTLPPEQIVSLKSQGLTDDVIIAMLKTAEAGDQAARADSAYASSMVAAAMTTGPEVLIVGHGPERPDTYHYDGFFTNANNPYLFPLYNGYNGNGYNGYNGGAYPTTYAAPYVPSIAGVLPLGPTRAFRHGQATQPRSMCYAQVNSGPSRGSSLTTVTQCPPVLQPSRRLR